MGKEIIIFLITYFISTVIRGFIIAYTGFYSINIFHDKFQLIPFIFDVMIWTTIYIGVRFLMNKFTQKKI